MSGWQLRFTKRERKVFIACFGGWALDALDAQMLSLVIPALLVGWAISKTQAGLISTASLVASAIGGWITGGLADRYGRVRMLQWTVVCFSVFSFLSAFAQNLPQLVFLKLLQGLGFGGEWAVGSVLMAETIRSTDRGKAMALVQSGWSVGWGAAVILYALVSSRFPLQYSWRVMFAFGLLPALLIFYIQRSIPEPEWISKASSESNGRWFMALFQIFRANSIRMTCIASLLGIGAHGGYYAVATWLPTYLRSERHLSVLGTSGYLTVIIGAFWCGCAASAAMLDNIGRRKTILLFAICCVLTVCVYLFVPLPNGLVLILGFPLGFFSAGIPASLGTLLSELFGHEIRGTAVGFCYNAGRLFAAALPVLVGKLSANRSLASAIGIYATASYLIVVFAVLILPETRSRQLI